MFEYMTAQEAAEKWHVSLRWVQRFCKENWILEQLIEGRKIDDIPFNESELSLFYHQIKMISHKLDFEIGRADLAGLFHEELWLDYTKDFFPMSVRFFLIRKKSAKQHCHKSSPFILLKIIHETTLGQQLVDNQRLERLCMMQFCDLLMVWGCLRSIY